MDLCAFAISVPCRCRPKFQSLSTWKSAHGRNPRHLVRAGGRTSFRSSRRLAQATYMPDWEDIGKTERNPYLIASENVQIIEFHFRFLAEISEVDARAVMLEYGRKTNNEKDVLRCDVLRQQAHINDDDIQKRTFHVWIYFANEPAKRAHVHTAHANKLRPLLEPHELPSENAAELSWLGQKFQEYKLLWPGAVNAWRSVTKIRRDSDDPATSKEIPSRNLRAELDDLAANVGLNDSIVIIATANVFEDQYIASAKALCKKYVRSYEDQISEMKSAVVKRVGVFSNPQNPRSITIIQVSKRQRQEDTSFDAQLAVELLDEDGWKVCHYDSIFPDLRGWEVHDFFDYPWNTPGDDGVVRNEYREGLRAVTVEEAFQLEQKLMEKKPTGVSQKQKRTSRFVRRLPFDELEGKKGKGKVEYSLCEGAASDSPSGSKVLPKNQSLSQQSFPSIPLEIPSSKADGRSDDIQQLRLSHGSGSFANLESKLRKMCRLQRDDFMRVYVVAGWNEARLQPFVMEMDAGIDEGRVGLWIGTNVFGASATLAKVAEGVSEARSRRADIIVGFGGGAVLDTAKAVAVMLPLTARNVPVVLTKIRDIAVNGQTYMDLSLSSRPFPLVLIPGTVGSGAELSDIAVLSAPMTDGTTRRIGVRFDYGNIPRLAVVDSRLVIPRRLHSEDAAMGGLQALAVAVEVLLCDRAPPQAIELAERALSRGHNAVLRARREPESSDGPAREAIVDLSTFAALARDACGGFGLALCLSLGLLDYAVPTVIGMDAPLRTVLPRVLAALLAEAPLKCEPCRPSQIIFNDDEATGYDLSVWLLRLAEDIGVPLVAAVGIVGNDAHSVVNRVIEGGLLSSCTDRRLVNTELLLRVIRGTLSQRLEL